MTRHGLFRALTALAVTAGILTPAVANAEPSANPGHDPRVAGSVQGLAISTAPCDPAGPSAADGTMADELNPQLHNKMAGYMNAYHVSCARAMVQAVKARGFNQKAAAITIAAAIVESSLNNYTEEVDYDSLGLYQMRRSLWCASDTQGCLDPGRATNWFLDTMQQNVPSWNDMAIGEVCWRVENPRADLRYLYAIEADDAVVIANALWSGTSGGPRYPYASGRVVSGRSADGRLETFAAGADGVYHSWQTAVNGQWSAWRLEGGPRNAQLGIASNADGRLELFALSDSTFDHMWQTAPSGNWSGWENFGGGGYRVAVGNNADGRIEVLASNSSGVFHRWQTAVNGGWGNWEGTFGGPANARLAVENAPDGRLEVFALSDSTFQHLWQTAVNGGWSSWENFGGGGHDVTAGFNQDGRIEVFASGPNGVFHRWQTSPTSWSDWTGTGGPANSELVTSRSVDGRVEVFAINSSTASHAWQTRPNAAYADWETFGGGGSEIGAGNNADGRIEVFGTSNVGVHHKWQTGFATWSEWDWLNGTGPGIA
ncbi:VCBS repeat-containing protein [Actinocrispum wychmicini]|nr:VCBS repeat-containing protein [Actinocrispum wychmicini]